MLTIPITPAPLNLPPAITPFAATLILATIIYIYLRKKEGPKDALFSTITITIPLGIILSLALFIAESAPLTVTTTTKDIQHRAEEAGYTYYEKLTEDKLKEPDQETIKLTENNTLALLENSTSKRCTATFKYKTYDTKTLEPKEYTYTVSCETD